MLSAVEDAALKERGTVQAASATKKTYCVNLSGAAVPAHHRGNKKTPSQTPYVGPVTIKGSPLNERKTKVHTATHSLTYLHNEDE